MRREHCRQIPPRPPRYVPSRRLPRAFSAAPQVLRLKNAGPQGCAAGRIRSSGGQLFWRFQKELPRRGESLAFGKGHAVGGAVGHNPISLIIPCHRVLGADGSLTGYAGGLEKKRALLELEGFTGPLPKVPRQPNPSSFR